MEKGERPLVIISQWDHKAGTVEKYSFLSDTLSLAWPLCNQSFKLGKAWVLCVYVCVRVRMYVLCIHGRLRLVLSVFL